MFITTLPKILFLDIETVSEHSDYKQLNEEIRDLWKHKAAFWLKNESDVKESHFSDLYEEKAGIYAEFGKIVCISMGILIVENKEIKTLRLSSIYGEDEKMLLNEFSNLLNKFFPSPEKFYLCGHNIKEFDVPYMARRLIINGQKLPEMLNISGKKPWETKFLLDTLEMWKFGDYKHFTSLKLLANVLGIPSPKDDIDGSQVGNVYWKANDINRIKEYCEKDVLTTVQVFLRLNGFETIPEEQVFSAEG